MEVTELKIFVNKEVPGAKLPTYATEEAACFDIFAAGIGFPITIGTYDQVQIRTGLSMEIPRGWCLEINSRSGHGFKHGVRLVNSTGIIDSDYRGEILVGLRNDSETPFVVEKGMAICQAKLARSPQIKLVSVDELSPTVRGANGFGSTDAKPQLPVRIVDLDPVREADGSYTHMQWPYFQEDDGTQFENWLHENKLETYTQLMEDDPAAEEAYERYSEGLSWKIEWEPKPPTSEGWILFAVHDTEDGPVAVHICNRD